MVVQKFGGSSVEDAGKMKQVAQIAISHLDGGRIVIVLSALRGCTDLLIRSAQEAEKGLPTYREALATFRQRHIDAVRELTSGADREKLEASITQTIDDLSDILHGVELVRECSGRSLDLIAGFGERLSCRIMTGYLNHIGQQATYIDAGQNFIITDDNHGNGTVDFEHSYKNIEKTLSGLKGIAVVTGYVASTADGRPTTLGRNGSDYTASIVGAGIKADAVEIWKDVDGVLTADPRFVKNVFVLDEISMEEAMEMSYFGAKVIHPSTMVPLIQRAIPLRIKNTLNPSVKGTLISHKPKKHDRPITGIASINNVALINIEGSGMIGIPGFASRVFTALAGAKANVIMISQASSEHSICVIVREDEAQAAVEALRHELKAERQAGMIRECELVKGLEIIAVIGENMRGKPGITGRLFSSLGEAKVNVLAIAQGSSERNISFVIENKDRELALNTVHKAFLG